MLNATVVVYTIIQALERIPVLLNIDCMRFFEYIIINC